MRLGRWELRFRLLSWLAHREYLLSLTGVFRDPAWTIWWFGPLELWRYDV